LKKAQLQEVYLDSTNNTLPNLSKKRNWPVRFNHCFQRIILDHLFEDSWYNHLSRKEAAYKQLNTDQLEQAVKFIEKIIRSEDTFLVEANRNSLKWRGKLK
jgi:hypothetical protein